MPTITGGIVSLLVIVTIFLFGLLKLDHLLKKKNPSLSKFDDSIGSDIVVKFDLDKGKNVQMAFAIENFHTGLLNDDRFFKFVAKRYSKIEDVFTTTHYPMHRCTEADYATFYPIESRIANKVNKMKKMNALSCLNWDNIDFPLHGTWTSGDDYEALDIIVLPCGTEVTMFDDSVDKGHENCNWDQQAALDYFGDTYSLITIFNEG